MSEARDVYEYLMEEEAGGIKPYLDPGRLQQQHQRAKDKALHAFHAKRKMGGDELEASYQERLVKVYYYDELLRSSTFSSGVTLVTRHFK